MVYTFLNNPTTIYAELFNLRRLGCHKQVFHASGSTFWTGKIVWWFMGSMNSLNEPASRTWRAWILWFNYLPVYIAPSTQADYTRVMSSNIASTCDQLSRKTAGYVQKHLECSEGSFCKTFSDLGYVWYHVWIGHESMTCSCTARPLWKKNSSRSPHFAGCLLSSNLNSQAASSRESELSHICNWARLPNMTLIEGRFINIANRYSNRWLAH